MSEDRRLMMVLMPRALKLLDSLGGRLCPAIEVVRNLVQIRQARLLHGLCPRGGSDAVRQAGIVVRSQGKSRPYSAPRRDRTQYRDAHHRATNQPLSHLHSSPIHHHSTFMPFPSSSKTSLLSCPLVVFVCESEFTSDCRRRPYSRRFGFRGQAAGAAWRDCGRCGRKRISPASVAA